jgi:3-hydroxyacyl-[acyl-carrier-protein] dehydratase
MAEAVPSRLGAHSAFPSSPPVHAHDEFADLRESLKRCSAHTFDAACEFRRTRDVTRVPEIVRGIMERYVDRSLRAKLAAPSDQLRLVEDLGLDSLSLIEIVLMIEDVFKISIDNDELSQAKTWADVRGLVAQKAAHL